VREDVAARAVAEQLLRERWGDDGGLVELPGAAVLRLTKDEDAIGWRVQLPPDYLGIDRQLDIILPSGFPNVPPRCRVSPDAYLEWPHADPGGKLCLWVEPEAPVWGSTEDLMVDALDQLSRVLQLVCAGSDEAARNAEFAREWTSYWRKPSDPLNLLRATVILTSIPESPTLILHTTRVRIPSIDDRNDNTFVVADRDANTVSSWVQNLGLPASDSDADTAVLIRLREAPCTPGAPESTETLASFIESYAEEPVAAKELVERLLNDAEHRQVWVIFVHDARALAGLLLSPRFGAKNAPNRRRRRAQTTKRPRIGTKFSVVHAERGDAAWVHGRGFEPEVQALSGKNVVLVGVGSLGGFVAENLALSGVGRLTLIDPGILETANIGRHTLGARCVGENKANALVSKLRSEYPHLAINAIDRSLFQLPDQSTSVFDETDLVVSTTADPSVEQFLAAAHANSKFSRLQIAWTEPFALAGHSALAASPACDLATLFKHGECVDAAIDWHGEVEYQLPGCGASHIPGSGNRVRLIAAMVVEHAIYSLVEQNPASDHRIWTAEPEKVKEHGGKLRQSSGTGEAILRQQPIAERTPAEECRR
jgi:hypothetical protein